MFVFSRRNDLYMCSINTPDNFFDFICFIKRSNYFFFFHLLKTFLPTLGKDALKKFRALYLKLVAPNEVFTKKKPISFTHFTKIGLSQADLMHRASASL